jgi:hypothetical protein
VVGIAALVIAGLGYWDSHRERVQSDRERAAAEVGRRAEAQADAKASAQKRAFLMTGHPESAGEMIRLAAARSDQVIETQALAFPADVHGEVQTTGNPRIEAGWLEGGLERALKARGVKAERGRVPVGVATNYVDDGAEKTDRAIYLVGYSLHGRTFRSARVELEGLSLLRRDVGEDLQKAVDTAWNHIAPLPTP